MDDLVTGNQGRAESANKEGWAVSSYWAEVQQAAKNHANWFLPVVLLGNSARLHALRDHSEVA